MDRDEMIERGARALRATFYPSRTIRQTPEDEWKRRAAAVVDAITPDEYEQVGWCVAVERELLCDDDLFIEPDEVVLCDRLYRAKRTPPDAPEPDRCPTCGSDDRMRVRAGCEYWKDDTLAHSWHQGADR